MDWLTSSHALEGISVRAQTRHQLKQDRFSQVTMEAAEKTFDWSSQHVKALIIAGIIVAVIAAAIGVAWYHFDQQDRAASIELNQVMRTLDAPVRPAGMPEQPGQISYASASDRATQAQKQLQAIMDKYPHTKTADFARYFHALTAADLGNDTLAENELKTVADSHQKDLAALGKFALASVYRRTNRAKDAIEIYKQLIAKPTRSVGKSMAQFELAATYQAAGLTADAKQTYQQIQKEDPSGPAAQMASAQLQDLK